MTGLDNIISSVLKESEQKAADMIEKASAEAEEKMKNAQIEEEKRMQQAEQEAEAAAEQLYARTQSAVQRKISQMMLKKKQELIHEAIEKAYEHLLQMTDEEFEFFVLKRLEKISPDTEGILYFVPRNGELISKELKKELKKQHPGLEISEEPLKQTDGGFILQIGLVQENSTFRALLEENMDALRDEAGRLLFEEAVQ